jgi:hypothetical protein
MSLEGGQRVGLYAVAAVDDQVFDFSELFVDSAKGGAGLLARAPELDLELCQLGRDLRYAALHISETEGVFPLIGTKHVDCGEYRTVVSLGSLQCRDARLPKSCKVATTAVYGHPGDR